MGDALDEIPSPPPRREGRGQGEVRVNGQLFRPMPARRSPHPGPLPIQWGEGVRWRVVRPVAEFNSAIRQIENLRYGVSVLAAL